MIYTELMRSILIEPWVVCRGLIVVPIHGCIWMSTCRMIICHIKKNSYSILVTCIDKVLIVLTCSISLIQSEICMRAITPAVISVKLLNRHKLNCIHTKILEIIDLTECRLDASFTVRIVCEITNKELVNNEVTLILDIIVLNLPIVDIFVDLEGRDESVVPAAVAVAIFLSETRIGRR